MDRTTHGFVGWAVVTAPTATALQGVVDQAPQAQAYYSDGCTTYAELVYGPAVYAALPDKSETYSVEGGNADLRHSLARLARKSRCFSRSIDGLRRAIKLLVWAYNQRQLWKQRYPTYSRHVIDFAPPPC